MRIIEKYKDFTIKYNYEDILFLTPFSLNFYSNEENNKNAQQGEIKENISYMRSVEITPSIIYYEVPKLERNNQIIRKFKKYQDHFIKISINKTELRRNYI